MIVYLCLSQPVFCVVCVHLCVGVTGYQTLPGYLLRNAVPLFSSTLVSLERKCFVLSVRLLILSDARWPDILITQGYEVRDTFHIYQVYREREKEEYADILMCKPTSLADVSSVVEGTARYAGLLLAPAEGFVLKQHPYFFNSNIHHKQTWIQQTWIQQTHIYNTHL